VYTNIKPSWPTALQFHKVMVKNLQKKRKLLVYVLCTPYIQFYVLI